MKSLILITLFSVSAFAQVDYSTKSEDQTPFRRMFEQPRIADKKAIFGTLNREEKNTVRTANTFWWLSTRGSTEDERDHLTRYVSKLSTMTEQDLDAFELEAITLFSPDDIALLFDSIGPYSRQACEVKSIANLKPNCWCSIGSSFNMACNDTCAGQGGGCSATEDGCGFGWWHSCDGGCNDGVPRNDLAKSFKAARSHAISFPLTL